MPEVVVFFEVDSCKEDCPFCVTDEATSKLFCKWLHPEIMDWNTINTEFNRPLKRCPFREENKEGKKKKK